MSVSVASEAEILAQSRAGENRAGCVFRPADAEIAAVFLVFFLHPLAVQLLPDVHRPNCGNEVGRIRAPGQLLSACSCSCSCAVVVACGFFH